MEIENTPDLLKELLEFLTDTGYKDLRVLKDGTIVGTLDLIYTRALVIDMDRNGYTHRYCYETRSMATAACLAMQTGDDEPLPGYVAQRHLTIR